MKKRKLMKNIQWLLMTCLWYFTVFTVWLISTITANFKASLSMSGCWVHIPHQHPSDLNSGWIIAEVSAPLLRAHTVQTGHVVYSEALTWIKPSSTIICCTHQYLSVLLNEIKWSRNYTHTHTHTHTGSSHIQHLLSAAAGVFLWCKM